MSKKPISKREAFISALLNVGIHGINAKDAIKGNGRYWSSCLHTDVSLLNQAHGVQLDRKVEFFERKQGNKVSFTRYWIGQADDALRLIGVLNHLRVKRGCEALPDTEVKSIVSKFKEVTTQK